VDFTKYSDEELKAQYDKMVERQLHPVSPEEAAEIKQQLAAFGELKAEIKRRGVIL